MGGHPGIEMQKGRTELNLGKAEETMTGIVIDAMIGTVAMTETGIETMTAPVALIRGEGSVLDPGSAAGQISFASNFFYPLAPSLPSALLFALANPDCCFKFSGARIDTESVARWLAYFGVLLSSYMMVMVL
jgi:hypothetical protein